MPMTTSWQEQPSNQSYIHTDVGGGQLTKYIDHVRDLYRGINTSENQNIRIHRSPNVP